jgi:hypothetical protein
LIGLLLHEPHDQGVATQVVDGAYVVTAPLYGPFVDLFKHLGR